MQQIFSACCPCFESSEFRAVELALSLTLSHDSTRIYPQPSSLTTHNSMVVIIVKEALSPRGVTMSLALEFGSWYSQSFPVGFGIRKGVRWFLRLLRILTHVTKTDLQPSVLFIHARPNSVSSTLRYRKTSSRHACHYLLH